MSDTRANQRGTGDGLGSREKSSEKTMFELGAEGKRRP